ncbi:MAG: hypothetical protein ACK5XA_08445 [Tagaea sp.]
MIDAPPPAAAIGDRRTDTQADRYRRALESIVALLSGPIPDDSTDELLIALNTIARNALRK